MEFYRRVREIGETKQWTNFDDLFDVLDNSFDDQVGRYRTAIYEGNRLGEEFTQAKARFAKIIGLKD